MRGQLFKYYYLILAVINIFSLARARTEIVIILQTRLSLS